MGRFSTWRNKSKIRFGTVPPDRNSRCQVGVLVTDRKPVPQAPFSAVPIVINRDIDSLGNHEGRVVAVNIGYVKRLDKQISAVGECGLAVLRGPAER